MYSPVGTEAEITLEIAHLQHVAVVIFDADLPEALERQDAADAHLMKHLFHNIREGCRAPTGLSINSHAQQLGEPQVVFVNHIGQSLQHALIGRLESSVSEHCGDRLVQKLTAGQPAQLSDWLTFTSKRREMWRKIEREQDI